MNKTATTTKSKIDLLSSDWVLKNYKFIIFLGILCVIYINNSHKMEKKFRAMSVLKIEVANLKTVYKGRLAQYAAFQKPTNGFRMGKTVGLTSAGPIPKKIVIKKQ